MHMVFWLHRGVEPEYQYPLVDDRPATVTFLELLGRNGELDADDTRQIREALDFLFRTRMKCTITARC